MHSFQLRLKTTATNTGVAKGRGRVETALDAERFIEQNGFTACLADSRRPGPSLVRAVCGRRDAVMPRNAQKDPEASHTWQLKDELVRRGKVYYAKLARGKATFIAPHMNLLLSRRVGRAQIRRETATEQECPRGLARAPQRVGDGHGGPAR